MTLYDLYFGDIPDKLVTACLLWDRFRSVLESSCAIGDQCFLLISERVALEQQMESMGMGRLCSECAQQPPGGCCSAQMANETDAVLLLINLLMGMDRAVFPRNDHRLSTSSGHPRGSDSRSQHDDCCFLGPLGCTLPYKPIFCLNYNCRAIIQTASPRDLQALERATAALLNTQVDLERIILQELRF